MRFPLQREAQTLDTRGHEPDDDSDLEQESRCQFGARYGGGGRCLSQLTAMLPPGERPSMSPIAQRTVGHVPDAVDVGGSYCGRIGTVACLESRKRVRQGWFLC